MKTLILFILLLSQIVVNAQSFKEEFLQQDKVAHATLSIAITSLCINTYADYPKIKNPEVLGVLTGIIIVSAKEYVHDQYICKEKANAGDLVVSVVSCAFAPYINRAFNKWEMKHFYKKK
jgi:hypothetical protein